jgi:hypothetical protein
MATELLRQVRLRAGGNTELTCWVDKHVKVGNLITLKNSDDPGELWTVMEVYDTGAPPERGWKVGGIM